MKRFWQICLLMLLVVAMVLPIIACGKTDDKGDGTNNNGNGNGTEIDLTGISLKGAQVNADGKVKTLAITGKLPDGVQVRYEYWNEENTEKVSDTGVTAVGKYTVRAIFTKSGCADKTLTARLVLLEGTPIDLSSVRFTLSSVDYDGEYHKALEKNLRGNSNPQRVNIRFEYWNADETVMVDDGQLGVKDPGVYIVRAIYSDPKGDYIDAYVTAKLIISETYNVRYTGPDGTVFPTDNPNTYSLARIDEEPVSLKHPSLEGYSFEGWFYTNAATGVEKLVEELSTANFSTGGDITLTAKFHKQAPFPETYRYTTDLPAELPTELPAIPGYDKIQKDAVCILDMSNFSDPETVADELTKYGIKYANLTSDMNSTGMIKAATPATGGGYALRWGDYEWRDDGQYASSMVIGKPNSMGYNLANYNLLEFWVYSAAVTEQEQAFTVFIMTGGTNNLTMTYTVKLDYSGWKKFSIRLNGSTSDLYAPAGIKDTITEIRLLGTPNRELRSTEANIATEEMKDQHNYIYFSNFYLTNYKSSYSIPGNLPEIDLVRTRMAMSTLTRKATLTDAEIAALLGKMNLNADGTAIADDATRVFNDLSDIATIQDYKPICERLCNMATAWKCPTSTYYKSEALLNAVVAGINALMPPSQEDLVAIRPAYDADIAAICLSIADTMNVFGDYLGREHALSWGSMILEYYPSSIGTSTDAFLASYIYVTVQMGLGNVREAVTGIGQLAHAFENREITLATTAVDFTRFTSLFAVMTDNMITDDFIGAIFNWFYECVDAMTIDGKVPTMLTGCDLVPYIRALLPMYARATTEVQNKFASYVKMYMAKDAGLANRLAAAQVYDVEATALAAIQANGTAAATPVTDYVGVYEAIGMALYKTANGYLLITPNGVYTSGDIDASAITAVAADATFYGRAADGALALVRGTQLIAVYNGQVTVANTSEGALVAGDDAVRILVVSPTLADPKELNDNFYAAVGTPIIAIAKIDAEAGTVRMTVYAYAGETSLGINRVCVSQNMDGWKVNPDADSGTSTILIDPDAKDSAGKPVTSDKTFVRVLTLQK